MFVLGLHAVMSISLLLESENRTWLNFAVTLPLLLHSLLMVLYCGVLLSAQYSVIFLAQTTNEQFNGWRYKYMTPDLSDPKKRKMKTPFDEGPVRNCMNFCKLRKAKKVTATVEMATRQLEAPDDDAAAESRTKEQQRMGRRIRRCAR